MPLAAGRSLVKTQPHVSDQTGPPTDLFPRAVFACELHVSMHHKLGLLLSCCALSAYFELLTLVVMVGITAIAILLLTRRCPLAFVCVH